MLFSAWNEPQSAGAGNLAGNPAKYGTNYGAVIFVEVGLWTVRDVTDIDVTKDPNFLNEKTIVDLNNKPLNPGLKEHIEGLLAEHLQSKFQALLWLKPVIPLLWNYLN